MPNTQNNSLPKNNPPQKDNPPKQMLERHYRIIEEKMHTSLMTAEPMKGGWMNDTRRIVLRNGEIYVAKISTSKAIASEAMMLDKLRPLINTPKVYIAQDDMLLMEYIQHNHQPRILHAQPGLVLMDKIKPDTLLSLQAEEDAGRKIAHLHRYTRGKYFGFDENVISCGVFIDNTPSNHWVQFFAERRLMPMAQAAVASNNLHKRMMPALEKICANMQNYIKPPKFPSLLHGDLWRGNMLYDDVSLLGVIDPAIYYGHHEVDLAMILMFNPVSDVFFKSYSDVLPIDKDFFTTPIVAYQLYGYLLHCRLYGSDYQAHVERWMARLLGNKS
ncbi:MAG: fructosamine kinase family protein [Alphaproteobacteria bacterium]|nr:fructosamine kinase family protein [Alphaproteobacteria bacterium]